MTVHLDSAETRRSSPLHHRAALGGPPPPEPQAPGEDFDQSANFRVRFDKRGTSH